jgi:hypothetical protein
MRIRKPKIGDRVAIRAHALVFFIKSVNEAEKTVDAETATVVPHVEKNIPWKLLTFIDLNRQTRPARTKHGQLN